MPGGDRSVSAEGVRASFDLHRFLVDALVRGVTEREERLLGELQQLTREVEELCAVLCVGFVWCIRTGKPTFDTSRPFARLERGWSARFFWSSIVVVFAFVLRKSTESCAF